MFWLSQMTLLSPIWQTVLNDSEFIRNLYDELLLKRVTQPNFSVMIFFILLPNMHWILISSVDVTRISCSLASLIWRVRRKGRIVILWRSEDALDWENINQPGASRVFFFFFSLPIFTGLWKPERRFIPFLLSFDTVFKAGQIGDILALVNIL